MSTVPSKPILKLAFYEAHIDPWNTSATLIGLVTTEVTALNAKAVAARAAYLAHVAAQDAAAAATLDFATKIRQLHNAPGAGADMIRKIRTRAITTNDPGVYVLAAIPAPATPSPVGPPGTPTTFKATLNPDGSLKITFKCPNPAGSVGTIYQVARQLDGAGPFVPLTGTGSRSFIDASVPAGSSSVTYRIVAVRSTAVGDAGQFTVNFGTGAGGEMIASVVSAGAVAPKIAA